MKKMTKILSVVLCLAMVLSFAVMAFAQEEQTFVKVTDVSELAVGDQVIIVADEEALALGTTQNNNNRAAVAITKNGDQATIADGVQVLTLEAGAVEGTFAFHTGSGYLYAASSSKNYLRTEDTLTANSSWLITIADGVTSVVAQGENTRNVMQYNPNNGSPLFACYDSAKMSALSIYKLAGGNSEGNETPENPEDPDVPVDTNVTIEEANAIGGAMEHNTFTEEKYTVTGVISEITSDVWGNMYIQDEAGNSLFIYGIYNADGSARFDVMDPQPAVGDTITVLGILGQYNGNPQMKNGWVQELVPGVKEENPEETPEENPDEEKPAFEVVSAPEAGVAYKFGMIQQNVSTTDVYYLNGAMNGYYMDTTTDAAAAADVYLEATEGGYYLYTLVGEAKLYINMVVNGTYVNGAFEETASTVYTYDAESKTLIATVNEALYWFGTRNDKSYTTVGPVKTEYNGFYMQFYAEAATGEEEGDNTVTPSDPPSTGDAIVAVIGAMLFSGVAMIVLSKKREF